jgi:acetylornithine/N-succinyldiaminopimelate aminotransferase
MSALKTHGVNATDIVQKAMDAGLLLNAPRPDTLRFMPALTLTEKEIDQAMEILSALFSVVTPEQV